MNSYVDIGGSEALALKGALLVYEGKGRGFVTWHEAKQHEAGGAPYLGEAQALTTEFVDRLAQGLGTRVVVELLPENILVRTPELIAWWTARTVRTMFFRQDDAVARKLNGRRFSQPALVWKVVGRDLYVRALAENCRPSVATKLMTAPYWNVDGETGSVCQGSMRSPDDIGIAAIAAWEKAFFQSEFTHQTGVRRLTTHPDGFYGLWQSMAAGRRRFADTYLVPAKESLQEFVRLGQ
jgi:PRTRC genetic system protein B